VLLGDRGGLSNLLGAKNDDEKTFLDILEEREKRGVRGCKIELAGAVNRFFLRKRISNSVTLKNHEDTPRRDTFHRST
jgi:hypothetical protein